MLKFAGFGASAAAWVVAAGAVVFCRSAISSDAPFYANSFERIPTAAAMSTLGRALFFDPSLSRSGKLACVSCHAANHAFGPPNSSATQRGGADGHRFGVRAVPSLMYLQNVPPFTEHFFDDEGDDSIDQGPTGGRTWDGRSQSTHDQARLPLFSSFEMGNTSERAVVDKVRRGTYARQFEDAFGTHVFDDSAAAFKGVLLSLETFQQAPAEFYPYTSKYDAWLRGEVSFSQAEARGMAAFNDPSKGNCARCHPSAARNGAFPQFTDFGFAAIGVPRNAHIPANADARYYDLGLCGPYRTDLNQKKEYCGMFRTPSLRNTAARSTFFHNGQFHRLEDVVRFYARRDTRPQDWYPAGTDGRVVKFDDLPAPYRRNVDVQAPFGGQRGGTPALSDADIADVVAFLKTLTDGYAAPQLELQR